MNRWAANVLLHLAALLVAAFPSASRAQWQFSHRLQTGLERDSNIYETSSRPTSAPVARLLFQSHAKGSGRLLSFQADYAGALLLYDDYRDENKLLHNLNGEILASGPGEFQLVLRGHAMLKLYLQSSTDYGATSGSGGIRFPLFDGLSLEVGGETGQLDYEATDLYDYTTVAGFAVLRQRFGRGGFLETTGQVQRLRYVRPAYTSYNAGPALISTDDQRDDLNTIRLAAGYSRKWILQAIIEGHFNRSNSLGYDYNRVRLQALCAFNPLPRWLLRASAMVQKKEYQDPAPPVIPPEFDPEREQSNHVVLDVSRELSSSITAMIRWALHNNESPVRGVFYRKRVLFAGIEIRL